MIKGAYTIFNNINSDEYTDQEKLHSIKDILSLVTHNSITKDSIISAFRWMCDYCLEEASKPTINGDKIRAMTDEELAEFINSFETCSLNYCRDKECLKCLDKWLKEEVEE